MTSDKEERTVHYSTGRLVANYLQENKDGATIAQIIQHLRANYSKNSDDLTCKVECILENGTALGFLEQKGSHYVNSKAKELCGRQGRRRSHCRRRHRRRIRHRCRKRHYR